jgi:modulator of FtsH protease
MTDLDAYTTTNWAPLFGALLGAIAALTGLMFVSMSINLTHILSEPILPGRAFQSMLVLMLPLFTSILILVPNQSIGLLGGEVLSLGVTVGAASTVIQRRAPTSLPKHLRRTYSTGLYVHYLVIVPYVIAGASLLLHSGGGLYWLVPGVVLAIVGALAGAWVLLVEIAR